MLKRVKVFGTYRHFRLQCSLLSQLLLPTTMIQHFFGILIQMSTQITKQYFLFFLSFKHKCRRLYLEYIVLRVRLALRF